jgi:alkanesulfonate monooxygenase SsuD/methylene tetrahydromethanopterin reductase-like flavin-dependent oxidoreductase (luciferase family)
LQRIAVCLACVHVPLASAAAQGGLPGASGRTEATTSATFPALPGPCTQVASGALTASVGGRCELQAPGGVVTLTTAAAGSRPDLRLSAQTQIVGTTTETRVSYTDRARATLTDQLTVLPRIGAPVAADIVFTAYLTGDPVGFAGLGGTWGSQARVELFVGEWGGGFSRLGSSLTPEFVKRFAVVGPPDHCIQRLLALRDAGLERLVVVGPGFYPAEWGEAGSLFARECLPVLRAAG